MIGYLLTLLAFFLIAVTAFWWVRRGYRSLNRLNREAEYAREMLPKSSRQLTADLHSALAEKQLRETADFVLIAEAVKFATDKQDGRLYALIPFEADNRPCVFLARWMNRKWKGTPIVEHNCGIDEALAKHTDSLIPID